MFQQEPTYHAAATFASGIALIHAIEECDCLDTAGIIAELRTMSILTGYGLLSFDENGQNSGGYVTHQLRLDQSLGTLTSSKDLVYPMPTWENRHAGSYRLASAGPAIKQNNANKTKYLHFLWNEWCLRFRKSVVELLATPTATASVTVQQDRYNMQTAAVCRHLNRYTSQWESAPPLRSPRT
jgi:hypothetical protein